MTTAAPTCPYCNAAITVQPGMKTGQRMACPRCGDSFALPPLDGIMDRPNPTSSANTAITNTAPPTLPPTPSSVTARRPNHIVAALVLGTMLVMAGGGLTFMLYTQSVRRGHDTNRPPRRPGRQPGVPEPKLAPSVSVSPDKLAAL